jgi:hypothetical protein
MAKSRTSRAADVSNALGVEEARNPLALMNREKSTIRISAAIAAEVTVRLLIGLFRRNPQHDRSHYEHLVLEITLPA